MPVADRPPGTPVLENYRKWDGTEHWQVEGVLLGTDDWGTWVGFPADSRMRRPGRDFRIPHARVALFPGSEGWAASFWSGGDTPDAADIYIDLATIPRWSADDGLTVSMIDLDLDVVRTFAGPSFIDDEDEFEEHTATYGYPVDVVATARRDADHLLDLVGCQTPPFDVATRTGWERILSGLVP